MRAWTINELPCKPRRQMRKVSREVGQREGGVDDILINGVVESRGTRAFKNRRTDLVGSFETENSKIDIPSGTTSHYQT